MIIGNAVSERQENIMANEGTNDRDFIVGTSSSNVAINESTVNVKTLERRFNERIDREMSNIVDTVEDRIQNAILTAIDNIVAPKMELAIRSKNPPSGRDATSVNANSERGEHVLISALFENASENNNVLHTSNANDETRHNIPDKVGDLSVPKTRFDRQTSTHHSSQAIKTKFILSWPQTHSLSLSLSLNSCRHLVPIFLARALCPLIVEEARFRMRVTLGVIFIRSLVNTKHVPVCLRSRSGVPLGLAGS